MRRLRLVDDEGALTERGNKWRNDSTYADACQEILDETYPDELSGLTASDGSPDKTQLNTWFSHKGFGGSNAKQMAATYALIAGRKPPSALGSPNGKEQNQPSATPKPRRPARTTLPPKDAVAETERTDSADDRHKTDGSGPNIHLDIQIHIPAAATAERIDQIFASMAKHLYRR